MDHTNYEELYPTVADPTARGYGDIYPQAVPNEESGENYPQVGVEHKDADSRYPIAVQNATVYNTPPPLPGTPFYGDTKHVFGKNPSQLPRPKKTLGMKRRTFWIVCGIVVVFIIGAVVGGVVGSRSSKKSATSGSSNPSSPTSILSSGSGPASATGTSPVLTSATAIGVATATVGGTVPSSSAINIHAIAAAVTIEGGTNYTFIAYQNTSSWQILYQFNSGNGTYETAQVMSLPITPIQQTPLAATSNAEDSGIAINVFYVSTSYQITNVNISCSSSTSYNCFIRNVTQISTSLTTPISHQTNLAAEYLGTIGWWVFYQDANSMLSVISSSSGGDTPWDTGAIIGLESVPGSSIASILQSGYRRVSVFYVRDDGGVMETVLWDSVRSEWLNSSQFPATTAPNFVASSGALAAVSHGGKEEDARLYYLGTDKQIYEYTDSSNIWTSSPDQSPQWALNDESQGRIAAVGWNDQIRLYYQSGDAVVQNALSGGVWSTASVV